MTTPWTITPIWQGETVCIIGAGPDMTPELAEQYKKYKTICVNRAIEFAPWADAFVALDPHHPFWDAAENFKGLKICGVDCPEIDGLYAGLWYERVTLRNGANVEIRNNALAAIRIAERLGAKKVILLGFDPERYEEVHAHTGFRGLVEGLEQVTADLQAKGIEVERVDSENKFPGTRPLKRGERKPGEVIDPKNFPRIKRTR